MKKALIKTIIYEYIEENNINNKDELINHLPNLYKYLKEHKHHKNVLPENLTYEIFLNEAKQGFIKAKIFNDMNKHFVNI
jgi:hypothetical protein